jgi:hypothetical protein
MLKRLFHVMQILTLPLPVIMFLIYIIQADGDQWTGEHYFVTGASFIPYIIVMAIKYIVFGFNKTIK